jgi:hypothetical protein
MTSMTKVRSWLDAVSRTLPIASHTVLSAVSKPMEVSVPETSLSMVPGMPTAGMPASVSASLPR